MPLGFEAWNEQQTLQVRSMCNLYHADLWIMPTIGSERALAAAIAASESA
jgi:hypothetical protein